MVKGESPGNSLGASNIDFQVPAKTGMDNIPLVPVLPNEVPAGQLTKQPIGQGRARVIRHQREESRGWMVPMTFVSNRWPSLMKELRARPKVIAGGRVHS